MGNRCRATVAAALVGASLGALGGCKVEVESLTYYRGTEETKPVAWASGQGLRIYNINGALTVKVGTEDRIIVKAQPFTRAEDEATAKKEMQDKETLTVLAADGDKPVQILASTTNASGYTGFDLEVLIPPSFDSSVMLEQKNGSIKVIGVANAKSADVKIKNGPIAANLGNAQIVVRSGNADVNVTVSGGAGGDVSTSNGSIDFHIPSGANANISATTQNGGLVSVEPSLPQTWREVSGSSATAKTWQCNNGSNFTYRLDASGTSLADVIVHAD